MKVTKLGEKILSDFDPLQNKVWIQQFYSFDIDKFHTAITRNKERFWVDLSEKRALQLFHRAARYVPAYKDFLKRNRLNSSQIKTIDDFQYIPYTDKKNYIECYPVEQRCWYGEMGSAQFIASSSGTTGTPTYWPRATYNDFESGIIHELLYRYIFKIKKYRTLLVICFPMGVYISGIATLFPSWLISGRKNYNMTIASIGNNREEVLKLISTLYKKYEKIVIAGHPYFVKEVIEEGKERGINWAQISLYTLFSSEGFSERWREHFIELAGQSFQKDKIVNLYGASELLAIAHETPLSIQLKRDIHNNKMLQKIIGVTSVDACVFQFNPLFRYVESTQSRELLFTAASGTPLIRYNLHDKGSVMPFDSLIKHIKYNKKSNSIWQLPFLFLEGRSDYAITFYAANIYPEQIKQCLDHSIFIKKITGRFKLNKVSTDGDASLHIYIELKKGIAPSVTFTQLLQKHIVHKLKEVNREYADAYLKAKKDLTPIIHICFYGDEKHFPVGLKPRYISK